MIFTHEPAPFRVQLCQVTAAGLVTQAVQAFPVRPGWQEITATFTVRAPGTYKPVIAYEGVEIVGRAVTVKTASKVVRFYNTVRGT